MKNKIEAMIFDVDGTLYSFDKGRAKVFRESEFGRKIQNNCVSFLEKKLNTSSEQALIVFEDFKSRFQGEVSLGLEKEMGIQRDLYFAETWNLDPGEFMEADSALSAQIASLEIKTGILSAAPRIWVEKVLDFLQLKPIFDPAIFTGDPDIRKPNPLAFMQLADFWSLKPSSILAIGDQEETDILPAKSIGMITAKVGGSGISAADFEAESVGKLLTKLTKEKII